MLFKDYLYLLKKYLKKKTSDSNLCRDLFNSVIENIEYNDSLPDFDKNKVSRILNGDRKIPLIIRDNIYDECLKDSLPEYFDEFIVPQLIPDHSNLIYELVRLLEKYPNISKDHLLTLKSIAKEQTLHLFLSEIFRLSVIEYKNVSDTEIGEDNKNTNLEKEPILSICGIDKNSSLINCFEIEKLHDNTKISKQIFEDKLIGYFDAVSNLHLTGEYKPATINGIIIPLYEKTEIDDDTKQLIKKYAKKTKIEISDDFFDLGGLKTNHLSSGALMGGIDIEGSSEEKQKYNLIYTIEEEICKYVKAMPFIREFNNIRFVKLALKNSGTAHDENISISLFFNKGSLLTIEEIANMGQDVFDYIVEDCDQKTRFGITRGLDYLDYDSTSGEIYSKNSDTSNFNYLSNLFGYENEETNKEEQLSRYFKYDIMSQEKIDILKVSIKEVIPYDAVSFPSIIMLKKDIKSIEYKIHSKYMSREIKGKIKVNKKSTHHDK